MNTFICPKCGKIWNKDVWYQKSLSYQNFLYMVSTGGKEINECCFSCGYVEEVKHIKDDNYEQMLKDEYMSHIDIRD